MQPSHKINVESNFHPWRPQDDDDEEQITLGCHQHADDDHDDQNGICALCSDAFLYALVSRFVLLHIFTLILHLTQIFIAFLRLLLEKINAFPIF